MIVKTSYREGSASALAQYVGRDGHVIRDRTGRELSDREVRGLVTHSEHYNMERSIILSPEQGDDLSRDEFDRATRQTLKEWSDGRPSARWAYAVHGDTEHRHAHAVVVGSKSDLYMDRDDIHQVRDRGREHYRERARQRERRKTREHAEARQRERERHEPARDRGGRSW